MPSCRNHKKQIKHLRPLHRKDSITRMLVSLGICYTPCLGNGHTTQFLRELEIPEKIISRVLKSLDFLD